MTGRPPLLPTAYRGSLRIFAEEQLRTRGADLQHGTRNAEGFVGGRLIHRCTDIKTGRWVEVTNGKGYAPHQFVADGS